MDITTRLARGWIAYQCRNDKYQKGALKLEWVNDEIEQLFKTDPLLLVDVIVEIYGINHSIEVLPVLAAGLLENLVKLNDNLVFEKIIQIAQKDLIMQFLLGGVWFDYSPLNKFHVQLKNYSIEMNEINYHKNFSC